MSNMLCSTQQSGLHAGCIGFSVSTPLPLRSQQGQNGSPCESDFGDICSHETAWQSTSRESSPTCLQPETAQNASDSVNRHQGAGKPPKLVCARGFFNGIVDYLSEPVLTEDSEHKSQNSEAIRSDSQDMQKADALALVNKQKSGKTSLANTQKGGNPSVKCQNERRKKAQMQLCAAGRGSLPLASSL